MLITRLAQYSDKGKFTGAYAGPAREHNETFEQNFARLYASKQMPRLSGIQIKAGMNLNEKGVLSPAADKPFTHILKPAGTSGYEALPIVEWMALALGGACDFAVPATALVPMPEGLPPTLLVERFDIREGGNDTRLLALEDFSSVLGVPIGAKYDSTMERVARAARPLSTAPDQDVAIVLKRALFAWLIADGDMHLKNLALLKIAEPGEETFSSVRMAPMYDVVTTRVFPRLSHDRMALKLNGKDDNLKNADFRKFATTAGLKASAANSIIDALIDKMRHAVDHTALPDLPDYGPNGKEMADKTLEIIQARVRAF